MPVSPASPSVDFGGSPSSPQEEGVSPDRVASSPQRCAAAALPEERGIEIPGDAALAASLQEQEYEIAATEERETGEHRPLQALPSLRLQRHQLGLCRICARRAYFAGSWCAYYA